ncbi:LysR family transcriptional regulator [Cupriavidus cauae]|nr:LysR family transcriptional regulator [Cupriavidus cauae]
MDLKQLRYFARIVELESITAAADALHIAQPSLSQHVANLEAELDARLLVRGPSGTRPTDTGLILYRHAKMVLRQMEEAKAAVQHGRDVPCGHVSVGLPTSTSRVLALPLLRHVTEHFPDITLEIVEGSSADLAESLALQKLDLAVAMDVQQRPNMQSTPLLDEQLMLVGRPIPERPGHPGHPHAITLAQAAALPLLLPSFPNSVRVLCDRALVSAGLQCRLVAETSAVSVLLSAVREGLGWTILPWSALAGDEDEALAAMSIADATLERRVSLCLSSSASLSLACRSVEAALQTIVSEMVASGQWKGVRLIGGASPG